MASLVPTGSDCFGGWSWTIEVFTPTPTWWLLFSCILPLAGGYGVAAVSEEGHNPPLGVTSASVLMATHCPCAAKAVGWGKRPF